MKEKKIEVRVGIYTYDELPQEYRNVVDAAKKATEQAYAPYSHFQVGAALLLDNGEIICGSNQENSAYPSGTCAERTTMFYANSRYPDAAPRILAVATQTGGKFLQRPITPCGACRQVLLESEVRYGKEIAVLLYGTDAIYKVGSVKDLLPLSFDSTYL